MATYTSNYGWTKPSGSDNVDISVLNDNLDNQDRTIHDAFLNMAPPFSESSTYAVDDIVLYGTGLYKCHTAVVTPGSWTGSTNWQVYKLSEGGSGGGGGTSNYNQLTNKPQINSVELSGNKTSAQLGLMASDGVVANPTGQTTGTLTALEVGGTKYAVPSGGTSDYTALTNKPSINGVTLSGNKTTSDLGIDKTAVGLGNVPNVSTNDQTPTFSQASTRNNIASGEKLSVIFGKIQKFFNDLKTVAYSGSYTDLTNTPSLANVATSGSYTDLSNKPQINSVELSGNKTTSDLGINADNVMMSDGVTNVEGAFNNLNGFLNPVGFNVTLNTNKVNFADGTDGNDGANICLKFPSLKIALMSVSLNISSTLSDDDISVPFTLPRNVRVNFNTKSNVTNLPYINYSGYLTGASYFPTGQVKIFAIFRYSNT